MDKYTELLNEYYMKFEDNSIYYNDKIKTWNRQDIVILLENAKNIGLISDIAKMDIESKLKDNEILIQKITKLNELESKIGNNNIIIQTVKQYSTIEELKVKFDNDIKINNIEKKDSSADFEEKSVYLNEYLKTTNANDIKEIKKQITLNEISDEKIEKILETEIIRNKKIKIFKYQVDNNKKEFEKHLDKCEHLFLELDQIYDLDVYEYKITNLKINILIDIIENYKRSFMKDRIVYNEFIKSKNKKDIEKLKDTINENTKVDLFIKELEKEKKVSNFLSDTIKKLEVFHDYKYNDLLKKYLPEYMNIKELKKNFPIDYEKAYEKVSLFADATKYIDEAIKFNMFHKNDKYIVEIDEIKEKFENGNFDEITIYKLKYFVIIIEFLDDFIEGYDYLPVIDDETTIIQNRWIENYKILNFENCNEFIINDYKKDYDKLVNSKRQAVDVFKYKKEITEFIANMKEKISVNILLKSSFEESIVDLKDNAEIIFRDFKLRRKDVEEIKSELVLMVAKIKKFNVDYSKLITPFYNTTRQLGIKKEKEIEDIKDYYIYSLAKSIEKRKQIYGTKKNISLQEVDSFIDLIEEKLYTLTQDQRISIYKGVEYMNNGYTSNCLIQGDVSVGKTIVTVALMFLAAKKGFKTVYIVPRKVLKFQHLKTLRKYNELFNYGLVIEDNNDNYQMKDIDIYLNGYSFNDKKFNEVEFELGIIDEIQLFGVEQRSAIQNKYPHIDMFYTTATPHPRTRLISLIGNMDIIEIRELPPGRKLKETNAFIEMNDDIYKKIELVKSRDEMTLVVCPLVNKRGVGNFESIDIAYESYSKRFPEYNIEKLTGSTSDDKKESIIQDCVDGKTDILIASKSIEVGIDIPRASVIVIHYPFSMSVKWGVSQLHQLRGRVGRNNQDSYCYIEAPYDLEIGSPTEAVISTQDVFELTKKDFNWRGFESVIGVRQSGTGGSEKDREKKIKAYEIIATKVPKMIEELDPELIIKLEKALINTKVANIN